MSIDPVAIQEFLDSFTLLSQDEETTLSEENPEAYAQYLIDLNTYTAYYQSVDVDVEVQGEEGQNYNEPFVSTVITKTEEAQAAATQAALISQVTELPAAVTKILSDEQRKVQSVFTVAENTEHGFSILAQDITDNTKNYQVYRMLKAWRETSSVKGLDEIEIIHSNGDQTLNLGPLRSSTLKTTTSTAVKQVKDTIINDTYNRS